MALPWVKLDTGIPTHDKFLALIHDPSPKRWQAAASYMFALAWSGAAGTDGRIPTYALASVHGTQATARLLVKHRLWEEKTGAWQVHNWDVHQLTTATADELANRRKRGAERTNCKRWHDPECWTDATGCRGIKRPAD